MANKIFGNRVKKLRMERGLSMDKLASILGITKSRISMWENNGVVPRDEVLLQLSSRSQSYAFSRRTPQSNEPPHPWPRPIASGQAYSLNTSRRKL